MKTLATVLAVLAMSSACGAQVSWKDIAKKAKDKIEKPASTAPTPAATPAPAPQPVGGAASSGAPGPSKLVECTAMAVSKPGESRSYYFYTAPFEGVSDQEILGRANPYLGPMWQAMRAAWREHLISAHPDRFDCIQYIAYQCGTPKVVAYRAPTDHPEWATLEDWRYTEASLSDSDKLTAAGGNGAPHGVCAAANAAGIAARGQGTVHGFGPTSGGNSEHGTISGFISCSTTPEGGLNTYFSDVFPIELAAHPTHVGAAIDGAALQKVNDEFDQYLTKMGYRFKPGDPFACDFSPNEPQARAAKHKRAYEGNPCSNCGKVVETGWKKPS